MTPTEPLEPICWTCGGPNTHPTTRNCEKCKAGWRSDKPRKTVPRENYDHAVSTLRLIANGHSKGFSSAKEFAHASLLRLGEKP